MMKMMKLKIGIAATAAIAGLTVAAPSAYAYGNCYHYADAGWAQVFTEANYNGNCFEWQLGTFTQFPDYMVSQDASLRSWAFYNGQFGYLINTNDNISWRFFGGQDYPQLGSPVYNLMDAGE
jgi:hypothetical protein